MDPGSKAYWEDDEVRHTGKTEKEVITFPDLDPGISKRIRNGSITMVNLKSFPDGKQCSPDINARGRR